MTTVQTRTTYRALLRELPRHNKTPLLATPPRPLHLRLREHFRAPTTNATETQTRLQEAEQLATYARAQRNYAVLLERYNPGITMTEEEKVRLTARRVGMDLPEEVTPGGRENGEGEGRS